MKKWYAEDWQFTISVTNTDKEGKAEECRLGLEPGDAFICAYATPCDFCPTAFIKIFPALEVMRCQGDLRFLGAKQANEIDVLCPDGVVLFKVTGKKVK